MDLPNSNSKPNPKLPPPIETKPVVMIVACDALTRGIGNKGEIPWNGFFPEDMRFFRKMTTETKDKTKQNAVIMGRRTFESIGSKPLPHRFNICVSKNNYIDIDKYCSSICGCPNHCPNTANSLQNALYIASKCPNIETIYIIGGQQIYQQSIPYCDKIIVNEIYQTSFQDFDAFFPKIDNMNLFSWQEVIPISENVTTHIYHAIRN